MTQRVERLDDAFRCFGYVVISEPALGMEDVFEDSLESGLAKVERTFAFNAKKYNYRGKSKRAISALHSCLPVPCFGVEVLR